MRTILGLNGRCPILFEIGRTHPAHAPHLSDTQFWSAFMATAKWYQDSGRANGSKEAGMSGFSGS